MVRRTSYQRMILPRRALAERAADVLGRWWALLDALRPAHTMLFGVWNAHSIYLENSLLNLTSFAEGYHERLHDYPRIDPDEHTQLVKQALEPLPERIRWIYKQALRYAYRQTQRERLTDIIERAQSLVPEVAADVELLVRPTRRYAEPLNPLGRPRPERRGGLRAR